MHPARMQLAAERSCLLLCLPSVFSCPPNTYSSYKGGTWFFFFSCFREVVKNFLRQLNWLLPHHQEKPARAYTAL